MPQSDWRARAGTTFRCEKQPATGSARHGGHQPSARLRRRRGDAGRRRQRDRCRDRRVLHADRGRADDGRHPRRRHGAYPPGRRPPRGDRQPEHGAARHRPDDLHARSRTPRPARWTRSAARTPSARPSVAVARQPEGLVRGAGALRHVLAGRCDGAGDPPCLARLPRHPLSARMRRGLRRRHGARRGDRHAVSARWRADRGRHAAGHRRLCRDAAQHRARRAGPAVHRRARRALRRAHGEDRRLHHARRPDRAIAPSSARRCAAPIAASRSSGRRRPRPGRCTSSRC